MKKLGEMFRASVIKVGEEDKYIITCGEYQVIKEIFDTEEEAEAYYKSKWNEDLEPFILAVCVVTSDFKERYEKSLKASKEE